MYGRGVSEFFPIQLDGVGGHGVVLRALFLSHLPISRHGTVVQVFLRGHNAHEEEIMATLDGFLRWQHAAPLRRPPHPPAALSPQRAADAAASTAARTAPLPGFLQFRGAG